MYRGKPGAIVVNKYGERIGNEASAYHVFNRAFWNWDTGKFEWRNTPSISFVIHLSQNAITCLEVDIKLVLFRIG